MPRVDADIDTDVAPELVRKALIDFSPRRPEIWPGITPSYYEVREVGETWADVREGTKMGPTGAWAVEHYDWSDPEVVRWTVKESNFCAPGSYVSARIASAANGGSHIDITWERTPTSLMGRIATFVIVRTKGKPVVSSFEKGLAKIREGAAN